MNIDAALVWGGLIIALLDSTGYGDEINNLIDRIIKSTMMSFRYKEFPVRSWYNSFHIWLMVQSLLQGHESGTRKLPKELAEMPGFQKEVMSIRKLRSMGERRMVFRKTLNRFFMSVISVVCYVAEWLLVAVIWAPLWYVLVELSMSPGYALVITAFIGVFFNVVLFEQIFTVAHFITVTTIAMVFSVLIFLLFFPLLLFRLIPTGYLSAAGVLIASLGAYQHLSG